MTSSLASAARNHGYTSSGINSAVGPRLILRALGLGIAGGFRSLPSLEVLTLNYDEAPVKYGWRSWPVFDSEWGRRLLITVGAAEFVTDKLPWTQSRLTLSVQPSTLDTGLLDRTALATPAGSALGTEHPEKRSVATGAAFAAVGALLGNYGGYYARQAVVKATNLPDPTVAAAEDVVTVTLLSAAVRNR